MTRGSGGAWTGREVRTVPGESMLAGDTGEMGDGVKPVVATESYVKVDTRLLSPPTAAAGPERGCRWPV
jgi:hypothetical protein